jgi:hypothetical protein
VQRALAVHPQVQVVFDLLEPNSPQQLKLFELLRVWPGETLPRWQFERQVAPQTTVLLLKQGIFTPRHRAAGFGLLRNPYAAFVSLWHYEARRLGERGADAVRNLLLWRQFREPRLLVWADAMQPALLPALRAERALVHYEDFVVAPEAELRRICTAIGLPWDPSVLHSHRHFRPGQIGHGGIDLSAPIRPAADWAPDPQVPLRPFIEAVRTAPLRRWDDLYLERKVALPC